MNKDSVANYSTKDTIQNNPQVDSAFNLGITDSPNILSVLTGNSVVLFKQADTMSFVLHEIPFHSTCLVFKSDILEMKSVIRCIHDSCLGYVRRKDLFHSFPSEFQPEIQYLVWIASDDSVKVCKLNTKTLVIEDQISLKNTGLYINPGLLNSQSWTETSTAIRIEMNPASCEATYVSHVVDYRDKLKFLITTFSSAEEGGSWESYVVLKKGLLVQVVETEKWHDPEVEDDPVREKTEITEYEWNGDTLEFISKNLISGN